VKIDGRFRRHCVERLEARFRKNPRNGCRTGAAVLSPCPAHPEISEPTPRR
jgi:hypothetical protein